MAPFSVGAGPFVSATAGVGSDGTRAASGSNGLCEEPLDFFFFSPLETRNGANRHSTRLGGLAVLLGELSKVETYLRRSGLSLFSMFAPAQSPVFFSTLFSFKPVRRVRSAGDCSSTPNGSKKSQLTHFTTSCSPHHAGCEASTFTNTNVPFIATARATPGT